jgi:hypothetical protein
MRLDQFEVGVAFVMGALTGTFLTIWLWLQPMRKEAVEHGYAEWVVNASGDAKWQWKEGAK